MKDSMKTLPESLKKALEENGYIILKEQNIELVPNFRKTISLPSEKIKTLLEYNIVDPNEAYILIIVKKKA